MKYGKRGRGFFIHHKNKNAPLWIAVRYSVLWSDDPNMQDAKGTPIQPPGAHNPVALWAERPDHWPGF